MSILKQVLYCTVFLVVKPNASPLDVSPSELTGNDKVSNFTKQRMTTGGGPPQTQMSLCFIFSCFLKQFYPKINFTYIVILFLSAGGK